MVAGWTGWTGLGAESFLESLLEPFGPVLGLGTIIPDLVSSARDVVQLCEAAAATMSWATGIFWMSEWAPEKGSPAVLLMTLAALTR